MKKAIIHIGGHKTGSTAIQSFCASNATYLQQIGLVYPLELLTDINIDGLQAHHGLVNFFMDDSLLWDSVDLKPKAVANIGCYLLSLPRDKNILLSSENFTWLDENAIDNFKKLLDGYDVHIVLYVRRQDNALQALYQTSVLYNKETGTFDEYVESSHPIFEYDQIASRWQSAFGSGKITVRIYEKDQLDHNDSKLDFIYVLGDILKIDIDVSNWNHESYVINHGTPEHIVSLVSYYNSLASGNRIVPKIKEIANSLYPDARGTYELISPSQRKTLLASFAQSNERLASEFLGREDGVLFYDLSIKQTDEEWNDKYNYKGSDFYSLLCDVIDYLTIDNKGAEKLDNIENDSDLNSLPDVDDKQADILRDEALVAIQHENWEFALEKLQIAHLIRPNGPHIRLQLINALVHLNRLDEIAPHLDFLKTPPDYILNEPSLNNLLNQLRSILSLTDKILMYKGLHTEAKKLPIEEWITLVGKSTEQKISLGEAFMPSAPPSEKQAIFHGNFGHAAIKSAAPVYRYVLQSCQQQGIDSIKTLLDFGCGWGRFTRLFVRDVEEAGLIAIDPWGEALQMCREHMPYAAFVRSEFNPPLAFRDELFDVVFANSIFSHLSEANALAWIKEISRILRPGGVLIATTHSKHWLEKVKEFQSGEKPCESDWHRGFKNSEVDFVKAISFHKNGKFIFAPTGGVSGNPDYGDSFVPEKYIQKVWGEFLEPVEFIDDPARFPQATFTLRKKVK